MSLNERNPHISVIPIGSVATGATATLPGIFFRKKSRIKNVYYVDQAAVTKDNTNHLTISLQDTTGTPVVYATADTSDAAVTAVTQYPLTLQSPTDADTNHLEKEVPAGTQLNPKVISGGSAVGTKAVMLVEWYPL